MSIEQTLDELLTETKEANKLLRALIQGLAVEALRTAAPGAPVPVEGLFPKPPTPFQPAAGARFEVAVYGAPSPMPDESFPGTAPHSYEASVNAAKEIIDWARKYNQPTESKEYSTSAILCGHANESTRWCQCLNNCYCRAPGHTCDDRKQQNPDNGFATK